MLEAYLPSVTAAAEAYRAGGHGDVEIVVVDDAGGDGTPEWIKSHCSNGLNLIVHERNCGFAAACQTGFEQARFPIVLLLNNDVRLERNCIAPMAEHFADPRVFAVTGKIFNQNGDIFCNGGKVAHFRHGMWSTYENYDVMTDARYDHALLSFTAIGAFSAFGRVRFLELGGFDPLAAMVEDVEISYRGWKRGWWVIYEPRSIAYHDASQTMDKRYSRSSLDQLSRRSRILMHWMLLHDRKMFRQHVLTIAARFLTSWLILDWRFYWAVFTGLANLPAIVRKRRITRRTMVCPDAELLRLLEKFYRTAPIALRKA